MGAAAAIAAVVTALTANVAHNRRVKPQLQKSVVSAPSSPIDKKEDEDKISLGSDRAADKERRSKGRRQLMATQSSSDSATKTGLQV